MKALLACDLDGTLVGDPKGLRQLLRQLTPLRGRLGLVYATGRSLGSARSLMSKAGLPVPDAIIAEVGSAIHFPPFWGRDHFWSRHLDHHWDPRYVRAAANQLRELKRQPAANHTYYKCSYDLQPTALPYVLPALDELLGGYRVEHRLVYSSALQLDVLPRRAGKGRALRYVTRHFNLSSSQVLACGDSGNDIDLLGHGGPAALVANALPELVSSAPIGAFQASADFAAGVLEAIEHFHWLGVQSG